MTERMDEVATARDHARATADAGAGAATTARLPRRKTKDAPASDAAAAPSAVTGTVQLFADAVNAGIHARQIQFDAHNPGASSPADVHRAAAHGLSGSGGALPHLGAIQKAFGHHDVSGVRAHVGGRAEEASQAIGARAYASGDQVAFAASPDLQLAAHEAAHVVQQRGGVRLAGGIGSAGDAYEQHADQVADLVVRGKSAEGLLDQMAHRGAAGGSAVQRDVAVAEAVVGPGAAPRADAAVPGMTTTAEGHIRLHTFSMMSTPIPVGPYAFLSSIKADGMVDYSVGPGAPATTAHGTPPPPGPSTEAHVGPGAARGHGHGHALGFQVEVAHHLAELWGNTHVDVTTGGELSNREASYGIGITGGNMQFGDFVVPLPTAEVNLVQWEAGEGVRFLVANLTIPVPASYAFHVPIGGQEIQIIPHLDVVFEFQPNWPVIASQLGLGSAEIGAEAATATTAIAEAGATAETTAAVGAEAAGVIEGAAMMEVAGLAMTIAAPLAAGVALAVIFEHEVGGMEDLTARARGTAHAVFNYSMAYTTTWFGIAGITGPGASQGAAAAERDRAAMLYAHPDLDPVAQARAWGPEAIYTRVYEITSPLAEASLRQRSGVDHDCLDGDVIHDRIAQVRWNGPLFRSFGAPAVR